MKVAEVYTTNQINKLGNAIIFLCEKMKPITKTHILKLVYIIEEISIKRYGIPFFDLRFDVWKLGPVSRDLFVELSSEEPELLDDYIAKEVINGSVSIVPKKQFSDDEFSDKEIELLNYIADRFLYCTAKELINFTHRKDTPWYNTALQNGVLDLLERGVMNSTDIPIDLSEAIKDDKQKMALYKDYKDFITHSKSFI